MRLFNRKRLNRTLPGKCLQHVKTESRQCLVALVPNDFREPEGSLLNEFSRLRKSWHLGNDEFGSVGAYRVRRCKLTSTQKLAPTEVLKNSPQVLKKLS
jgi:hypothetical protein